MTLIANPETTSTSTGVIQLATNKIRTDGGTQPRAEVSPTTVAEYAEAMREGATFPPVKVFYDGSAYWLADGFHRLVASEQAGLTEIATEVLQGTRRDAVLYSVGANAQHGLRRTNPDKRRAVETLLRDEEWGRWSDREIARRTATSNQFVSNLRKELGLTASSLSTVDSEKGEAGSGVERIYTDRYGNTSIMKVANIGTNKPEPEQDSYPQPNGERDQEGCLSVPAGMFRAGSYLSFGSPVYNDFDKTECLTCQHHVRALYNNGGKSLPLCTNPSEFMEKVRAHTLKLAEEKARAETDKLIEIVEATVTTAAKPEQAVVATKPGEYRKATYNGPSYDPDERVKQYEAARAAQLAQIEAEKQGQGQQLSSLQAIIMECLISDAMGRKDGRANTDGLLPFVNRFAREEGLRHTSSQEEFEEQLRELARIGAIKFLALNLVELTEKGTELLSSFRGEVITKPAQPAQIILQQPEDQPKLNQNELLLLQLLDLTTIQKNNHYIEMGEFFPVCQRYFLYHRGFQFAELAALANQFKNLEKLNYAHFNGTFCWITSPGRAKLSEAGVKKLEPLPEPAAALTTPQPVTAATDTIPPTINRQPQSMQVLTSTGRDDWGTPEAYADAARLVLGGRIDLDPASNPEANKVVKAVRFFTKEQDGLIQTWANPNGSPATVFTNPAFGGVQALFVKKLVEEFEAGRVKEAIVLVNLYYGYEWFAPLRSRPMCLVDHRIAFRHPDTGEEGDEAKASSVFVYFGNDPTRFYRVFSQFGYCCQPAKWS